MSLPKSHRLQHRQEFSAVYRQGSRRNTPFLTLRAWHPPQEATQSNLPPSKIGISISQKVSKRAVVRNRIKRQIRAALRQLLPRLQAGWWLVVVVRAGAQECDYVQFLQQLEQLLAEAEVLNGYS